MSDSMGRIPQEILDEIISRTDIVDVVGRYVPLKKQGQNFFGLCPFHHEKTPSFSVSPSKQIFYCFSCHSGGNVFKFLMEMEHLTFPEAVRKLAAEVGVKIPERERSEREQRALEKRNRLLKWNEFATFFYQAVLHSENGKQYTDYLDMRQLTDETREKFQLGGCLKGWDGLYCYLKKKGAQDEDLIEIGLVSPRNNGKGCYDRFRDRLMFPIKDANGRVVAFGGRIIDAEKAPQKYINSSDSSIFHKGRMVYGLDLAKPAIRERDQVLIVEGYMDVIACHQAGIANVVAPLGTALTEDQVKLLMRYSYHFVTAFDGDDAGVRATMRSIDLIEQLGGNARVLCIPERKDPDEYIKAYGVEAFKKLIENADNAYMFRLAQFQKRHPGDSLEQKLNILNDSMPYLARFQHPAELDIAISRTAERLFLSEQSIKNELNAYKRSGKRKKVQYESLENSEPQVQIKRQVRYPKNEALLLNVIATNPSVCDQIEAAGGRELFTSDLALCYENFREQYLHDQKIDSSRMEIDLSSIFANALMQHHDGFDGKSDEEMQKMAERAILELQYQRLNKRYRMLLNKIGSLEKGGQSEDMEQVLIKLEIIRQQKTQFEDKMRGDKQ